MAIDPTAAGRPSTAHVSLFEARAARLPLRAGARSRTFEVVSSEGILALKPRTTAKAATAARPRTAQASGASRAYEAHTPISTAASGPTDPDRWDAMLNRIGRQQNVPPLFLKAVMLAESGGRPDAVGDSGHSVGLFQLHDQGYGHGMGDSRFDPETNAQRGASGLAEAWHAGEQAGFGGEYAVRAAYDYSFNPGGGFAYQGDAVVKYYNQLLAEQGQPPLA